jgi:hypothetical protein
MDLTVGANAYAYDAEATRGISASRDHLLVYMRLRRRLFGPDVSRTE